MHLLTNAKIYTQYDQNPVVSAIVIHGNRVLAIGNNQQLQAELGGKAQITDIEGRTILPGLTDGHIHLEYYAFSLQKIVCETTTKAECLQRVSECAATTPLGKWILGHGWNQNEWPDLNAGGALSTSQGFPCAIDLDVAAPNHPVLLTAKSLHACWLNQQAMQCIGITAQTSDPVGGRILRYQMGEKLGKPTGIFLESAMELVTKSLPEPSQEETCQALLMGQTALWKMGITGVHDFDQRRCFMSLQTLRERNELGLRVVKGIPLQDLEYAIGLGLHSGFGDDLLRIGSIKAFADGALGPHTAAMFQPYDGNSLGDNSRGILLLDDEEIFEIGRRASANGLSLAVHAIGDRANHQVLNAYANLRKYEADHNLPHLRHRIEHVQLIQPEDASRMAKLGVVASMQPIHATSDMITADALWGKRVENAYAWRTIRDRGTPMAFGSDAPVECPNPFWGLHAAVTRRREDGSPGINGWQPAQRINISEAIQGYTTGPAFAAGIENHLGRLMPGYLADLIVLDTDPFTCDPDKLRDIQPLATMVNGNWVWQASA